MPKSHPWSENTTQKFIKLILYGLLYSRTPAGKKRETSIKQLPERTSIAKPTMLETKKKKKKIIIIKKNSQLVKVADCD